MNSLDKLQDEVLDLLRSEFVQPIHEEGIPDGLTVRRDPGGRVEPYISLQFGDVFAGGARNMASVKGHDYVMPISTQVMAPDPSIGRRLNNKLFRVLTGHQFENANPVEKRAVGGAIMTINQSDSASEVFMVPSWFRILFQYFDVV